MSTFTNEEYAKALYAFVRDLKDREAVTDVPYTRPQIWAAAQAIRDILDSTALRTIISDDIDTAISPATMSAERKKRLFGRVVEVMVALEIA